MKNVRVRIGRKVTFYLDSSGRGWRQGQRATVIGTSRKRNPMCESGLMLHVKSQGKRAWLDSHWFYEFQEPISLENLRAEDERIRRLVADRNRKNDKKWIIRVGKVLKNIP